jgi:hypothetical protein
VSPWYWGDRPVGVSGRAVALLALAALPLLSGCATRFLRHHAERRIAHKLEELIGPAERYQVRLIGTRDADIVAGRIRHIEIDGYHIRAGGQIDIESLHADLLNLHYHAPPGETVSVGESQLEIRFSQQALNDYLKRQHPESQPEITLNHGSVTLTGYLDLLGVPTPLTTTGRLEVVDHEKLIYRAETVQLTRDPARAEDAGGIGPDYVEKHLNPLLNVGHLHLPLHLDAIEIEPGHLVVQGSVYLAPHERRS